MQGSCFSDKGDNTKEHSVEVRDLKTEREAIGWHQEALFFLLKTGMGLALHRIFEVLQRCPGDAG